MQDYPDILATDSVGGSRSNLLARDNAVKSCFAGTTYPSTGLLQGMLCYRTDLNKLYVMEQVSPAIWREVILTSAIGTAATKNIGTSGDTIPKNDTANTFSALQTFAAGVALANQSITGNSGAITIDADVRLNANSTKKLNFLINGTSAMTVETDRGVVVGGPTGGSKGAGTLNAVDIYKNGNQIKTAAYKDTGTTGDTIPTWNNLGNAVALNLASQAEAEAGTAANKIMTPERTAQAIAALTPDSPSSGFEFIETKSAAGGVATLDFTTLNTQYRSFIFVLAGIRPASNSDFRVVMKTSGGFYGSTNDYGSLLHQFAGATESILNNGASRQVIPLVTGMLAVNSQGISGQLILDQGGLVSRRSSLKWDLGWADYNAVSLNLADGFGFLVADTANVTGVRFFFSTGNIAEGEISIYGCRRA